MVVQVHITSGNTPDHIIVTWTTKSKAPSVVYFGSQRGNYSSQAVGGSAKYTRGEYTSGHIHSAKIKGLTPSTTYFYALGGDMKNPMREFSVRTLPAVGPTEDLVFTVVGDLGQTLFSESTVMHVLEDDSQMVRTSLLQLPLLPNSFERGQ